MSKRPNGLSMIEVIVAFGVAWLWPAGRCPPRRVCRTARLSTRLLPEQKMISCSNRTRDWPPYPRGLPR